jgi:hypothetical protein
MKAKRRVLSLVCALFLWSSLRSGRDIHGGSRDGRQPCGRRQGSGLTGDLRFCLTNARSGDSIGFSVVRDDWTDRLSASPRLGYQRAGPGANVLTVHGIGGSVLSVGGTTISVSGLTVTGGVGNGGGVFNQGTLTLETRPSETTPRATRPAGMARGPASGTTSTRR